jgi:hypothetical protein
MACVRRNKCAVMSLSCRRFVDTHLCFNGFDQGEFGFGEVVYLLKVEPELPFRSQW